MKRYAGLLAGLLSFAHGTAAPASEPSPLLAIDQHRATVVERVVKECGDELAFAAIQGCIKSCRRRTRSLTSNGNASSPRSKRFALNWRPCVLRSQRWDWTDQPSPRRNDCLITAMGLRIQPGDAIAT